MYRYQLVLLILSLLVSCNRDSRPKVDTSHIKDTIYIDRFDQKFYAADVDLDALKNVYPYLFPVQYQDSIWYARMASEEELELARAVNTVFGALNEERKALEQLFKNVKYYHGDFEFPKVITLITNLDYQSKVIYADSLMFVSLDMYLGQDEQYYNEFPKYLSRNFKKEQMPVDVAKEIAARFVPLSRNRPFINTLIEEGKKMYLTDLYLPELSDDGKMGYRPEDAQWLKTNEEEIWKYFIENKLLYSTEKDLYARFIDAAPFSKFYIDIDKESPGSVGIWLGWQIVRSFMKNNDVALQKMLQMPADEIFNNSKYKPKK